MRSKKFDIKHHGFIIFISISISLQLNSIFLSSCILRIPSVIYYMLSFHPLQNSLKINVKEGKKIEK